MSAKRSASEDPSEAEEGEIKDRPVKAARRDDEPPLNDTNGVSGEAEPAATPLPISNPFQARFRAAGLSAGQYHVLDEAGSEDEGAAEASGDSGSDELDDDELMEMLDADLPEKFKGTRRVRARGSAEDADDDSAYEQRDKVVLIERGRNPVEPMPEGWVQVTHMSGMPVYLHRQSRVVTVTRPYFLGPGSLRKHDIPLYSIPCLQYLRELMKAGKEKGGTEPPSCPVSGDQPDRPSACPASGDGAKTPPAEDSTGTAGAEATTSNGDATVNDSAVMGGTEVAAESAQTAASNGDARVSGDPTGSVAQSPAELTAVDESAVQSAELGAEFSAADDSAARGQAETDTAADTPAESAAQSPAESTTVADESFSAAPTPSDSAAQSASESAAEGERSEQPNTNGTAGPKPVQGTSMIVKDPSITPEEMNEYCSRRFQFKTIRLMKFTTWRERRQYLRKKRTQRPQMSSKTKLLSFPIQPSRHSTAITGARLRQWVLNPGGKSYVCILHEYLQHVLREQPVYTYTELENAATPYGATVTVTGVQYGSGYGSSKKQAKSEAAKATLQIFIPNLMEQIDADKTVKGSTKPADMDLSFFDSIRLEDPRVADLCSKAAEPSPYTILLICLQRNFGLTGNQVTCQLYTNKHQHNEFEMKVGKHTARVPCKNKKDGKHLAAQSLLQQLHPHVTSWGSLLRMYGNHSSKSLKVKRQEEQQITLLQSKATVNSPNYAILEKLREEMSKLQEFRKQVRPIGILQLSDPQEEEAGQQGHSESGVTLDVVDL